MMKEHPILFSTSMVQAILRGEKTVTRRIINPQPTMKLQDGAWISPTTFLNDGKGSTFSHYGVVGDQLWVRESFVPNYFDDNKPAFKADWTGTAEEIINKPKWKPSIHMPREVSRIQLEITNIKVERLQDITEEDAFAEGIQIDAIQKEGKVHPLIRLTGKYLPLSYGDPTKAKSYYAALWDSLNEKRGYGWEKNPFVWSIEFKRIK